MMRPRGTVADEVVASVPQQETTSQTIMMIVGGGHGALSFASALFQAQSVSTALSDHPLSSSCVPISKYPIGTAALRLSQHGDSPLLRGPGFNGNSVGDFHA